MPRISLSTLLRLLVASFFVGLLLAAFDLTPRELVLAAKDLLRSLGEDLWGWLGWALSYVLLGAVVVVPVWAIGYLWKLVRRRS